MKKKISVIWNLQGEINMSYFEALKDNDMSGQGLFLAAGTI